MRLTVLNVDRAWGLSKKRQN